jgi:lysozyme
MVDPVLKRRLIAVSAAGAIAIASVMGSWFEGRRYVPYRDTGNVITVCDGHTGPDIVLNHRYTDAECDALHISDLHIADAAVTRYVEVPLNDWQRAALIDFTFNVGAGKLRSSTLLKKTNAGDYAGMCAEYFKWDKARNRHGVRVVLPGLAKRADAREWSCSYH